MTKMALLLSALLTVQAFAQQVGVTAGLALTTYRAQFRPPGSLDPVIRDRNIGLKPGLVLGSFVDFRLGPRLSFRSGAELVVKGGTETGTIESNGSAYPYRTSENFAAVDFPLQVVYTTGNEQGWLLGAGPVPGILVEGGLNKGDLGAGLLVGYRFRNGLQYRVSYNHGLLNVATHHYRYESLCNRHVALTVAYRFRNAPPPVAAPPVVAPTPTALQRPAQSLYAELGGSGGFFSLNYDTRLSKSVRGWGLRFGLGAITDLNSIGFTLPFGLNYLAGERSHFFEMGLGATYFSFREKNQDSWFRFQKEKSLAPHLWTGYRFQPPDKRFLFRAGFNLFFASGLDGFIRYPFPGFSFGYSLRQER